MWMKISLSLDQLASGQLMQIHDDFAWIFVSAGAPADVAMFGQSGADVLLTADGAGQFHKRPSVFDHVHKQAADEVAEYQTLYFSPAAAELAGGLMARYGGTPCKRPQRCALLVGQDGVVAQSLNG